MKIWYFLRTNVDSLLTFTQPSIVKRFGGMWEVFWWTGPKWKYNFYENPWKSIGENFVTGHSAPNPKPPSPLSNCWKPLKTCRLMIWSKKFCEKKVEKNFSILKIWRFGRLKSSKNMFWSIWNFFDFDFLKIFPLSIFSVLWRGHP